MVGLGTGFFFSFLGVGVGGFLFFFLPGVFAFFCFFFLCFCVFSFGGVLGFFAFFFVFFFWWEVFGECEGFCVALGVGFLLGGCFWGGGCLLRGLWCLFLGCGVWLWWGLFGLGILLFFLGGFVVCFFFFCLFLFWFSFMFV